MKKLIKIPKWFTKKIIDEVNNIIKLTGKSDQFQLKGLSDKDIDKINDFQVNIATANEARRVKEVMEAARNLAHAQLLILNPELNKYDGLHFDYKTGYFYAIEEGDKEHPITALEDAMKALENLI